MVVEIVKEPPPPPDDRVLLHCCAAIWSIEQHDVTLCFVLAGYWPDLPGRRSVWELGMF